MKILFLDQSGKPGGAELCLLDIAKPLRDRCLVGLLADGPFRSMLEQQQIPVQVLTDETIRVQKDSNLFQNLRSVKALMAPIIKVAQLSHEFDCIYANTQKALVIGAIASYLSKRPLVYHLHDIVSPAHFSSINRQIIINFANRFASLIIANSEATQRAFVAAGGCREKTTVVYNGFEPEQYQFSSTARSSIRQDLGFDNQFIVGHFSRLSPWKAQHILLQALTHCPNNVVAVFVGDALFGEAEYVAQLHQLVDTLGLQHRVKFLGFRSDISQLMAACDLITHTSIAPEPFGRVIVEAMLCERPIVATAEGGATELVNHGHTGWLVPVNDEHKLAEIIQFCQKHPKESSDIARKAQFEASQQFHLTKTNHQIIELLSKYLRRHH